MRAAGGARARGARAGGGRGAGRLAGAGGRAGRGAWGLACAGQVDKLSGEELELALGSSEKPMVIDFYASWCGPCVLMSEELEKVNMHPPSSLSPPQPPQAPPPPLRCPIWRGRGAALFEGTRVRLGGVGVQARREGD